MKEGRRSPSVSDKTFSWVMRLGVMVLAIGVGTFGFMYYQDQHVDAGEAREQARVAAVGAGEAHTSVRMRLVGCGHSVIFAACSVNAVK